MQRGARPATDSPKRLRLALIALSAGVLAFAVGCGVLLNVAPGQPKSPSAIVVNYYAEGANAAQAASNPVSASADKQAGSAPAVAAPANVAVQGANAAPPANAVPEAARVPAFVEALKWWSASTDAARLEREATLSEADFAAVAVKLRPAIPASSLQTLFGAQPQPIAPVEGTAYPPAVARVQCDTQVGTLVKDELVSPLLSRPLPVHVWLPPCYDPARQKYPALYLIQGSGDPMFGQYPKMGALEAAEFIHATGVVEPFLMVMPGNDMWVNGQGKYMWSEGGKDSWEDVIVKYLLPMIEQKYAARPDRESRAIGGISRGAYWSLEIGFSNADKFATVGAHSPATSKDLLIGEGESFTMLKWAKSLDDVRRLRLWLDAGDRDWARTGMADLVKQLGEKDVPFARSIGSGGHTPEYWASRMVEYLSFYTRGWSLSPERQIMPEIPAGR